MNETYPFLLLCTLCQAVRLPAGTRPQITGSRSLPLFLPRFPPHFPPPHSLSLEELAPGTTEGQMGP